MDSGLACGSRELRGSLLIIGEGVCDKVGSAAKMIVLAIKMDNEGLMRDICPLSTLGNSAATGGLHLTCGQKPLKYRQGYHPLKDAVRLKLKFVKSNVVSGR